MSAPLTAAYLAEVQARVMATTREDWAVYAAEVPGLVSFGPFSFVEGWDGDAHPADVEFASKARRDIPALLGEVTRLRALVAGLDPAEVLREAVDRQRSYAALHLTPELDDVIEELTNLIDPDAETANEAPVRALHAVTPGGAS